MRARCPICQKPTRSEQHAEFPFCSERCRRIDLGRWASEEYVISEPLTEPNASKPPTKTQPGKRNEDRRRR
ncbi:MAG: DNA gyrase inhibitor YacG [Firmicutes bacterium]|nr:DNA gyrase inhibitor YacG [Bacillota bacterium]